MSLNIKNQRVHDLARTVARRTGMTQTSAIETALEQYLKRLDATERAPEDRPVRVDWILSDMRLRIQAASNELDISDLYDEHGLPV